MMAKIPYTKPSIGDLEAKYANDAVTTGWGDNCYAYIKRFEEDFCRHLGVKHAIATSSCTGALISPSRSHRTNKKSFMTRRYSQSFSASSGVATRFKRETPPSSYYKKTRDGEVELVWSR